MNYDKIKRSGILFLLGKVRSHRCRAMTMIMEGIRNEYRPACLMPLPEKS